MPRRSSAVSLKPPAASRAERRARNASMFCRPLLIESNFHSMMNEIHTRLRRTKNSSISK